MMTAFLLRVLAPNSVAGALAFLTTAIDHLERVNARHAVLADKHHEVAQTARMLRDQSMDEMRRATAVKAKLQALVAAD